MQETSFNPWVGKIPWRKKWQPTGEFHGHRRMLSYSPCGRKESDMIELLTHKLPFRNKNELRTFSDEKDYSVCLS